MSVETAFKALETAIEHCTALQTEINKVPAEDRRCLMRVLEHLDLLEQALLKTAKELKEIE